MQKLLKKNSKTINFDDAEIADILPVNSLIRYVFTLIDTLTEKEKENHRDFKDIEYQVIAKGETKPCRCWLSTEWKAEDLVAAEDGNNLKALITVVNQYYSDRIVVKIIDELDVSKNFEVYIVPVNKNDRIPYEEYQPTDKLIHNQIIFGAPGTGKSHMFEKDRIKYFEETYERVTFHPDYTYSQFVGTYKPVPKQDDRDSITYKFIPGPFMRVLLASVKDLIVNGQNAKKHLLIVEEINRANVAAVFGDVFQLLDRDKYGLSEYPIATSEDMRRYLLEELKKDEEVTKKLSITDGIVDEIRIPGNMYIWATMNSADQGVFPMDTAFKRRWSFKYVGINDGEEEKSESEPSIDNLNEKQLMRLIR